GPTPRSGFIEPVWPTRVGAIIIEDLDDESGTPPTTPDSPTTDEDDDTFIDGDRRRRYDPNRVTRGDR
ncbi:hypothetical protein LCGC14_2136640, partial [marine sediment metagenome]